MAEVRVARDETYYEDMGPFPPAEASQADVYRFKCAIKHLVGDSVLEVGCGKGGFLDLIKDRYEVHGLEANAQRVDCANRLLGANIVKAGNLDDRLDFESGSIDTVVAMEVVEHLVSPEKALEELSRIARRRIVLTVPFNERIRLCRCVHCAKFTPVSGHLHTFNKETIHRIVPDGTYITRIELLANTALRRFPLLRAVFHLPVAISSVIDRLANRIFPRAKWMLIVIDRR